MAQAVIIEAQFGLYEEKTVEFSDGSTAEV